VQVVLFAFVFIDHIKPGRLLFAVIDGVASLFRSGVGIALLGFLLNLIACVAAGSRTGDSRNSFAAAAANLMTQEAADHGTESGSYQAILILHRLRMRNGFIVAILSRSLDGSSQCFGAEDFGRMGSLIHVVASERAAGGHHYGASKRAR
jgi:hypothetical protein